MADLMIPTEPSDMVRFLDFLSFCESGNKTDIVVWDSGSFSWGRFMYKIPTLKMYSVKYGMLPADLEDSDYANWALDGEFSYRLTERILSDGGYNNWKNCFNQYARNQP